VGGNTSLKILCCESYGPDADAGLALLLIAALRKRAAMPVEMPRQALQNTKKKRHKGEC
jgi:hypothetical protein